MILKWALTFKFKQTNKQTHTHTHTHTHTKASKQKNILNLITYDDAKETNHWKIKVVKHMKTNLL